MSDIGTPPTPAEKASAVKMIGFRPGADIRAKFETLKADTGVDFTEIVKLGIVAFWPEIETLVRAGARNGRMPESPEQLRRWLEACRAANARQIDPVKALGGAYETKLEYEAAGSRP